MNNMISRAMQSNLIIKAICGEKEPRQAVGEAYTIPDADTRLLMASLILEEALETIKGLGVTVSVNAGSGLGAIQNYRPENFTFRADGYAILEGVIDGCCDLQYVTVGVLAACGVPDVPHMNEVCEANERKFPGGKAIFNADGKYLKPPGWEGPKHYKVLDKVGRTPNIKDHSVFLLNCFQQGIIIE